MTRPARLLDRRALLGGGAALLAAPWLRLLDAPARAATLDGPRRLVVFFSPNGTIPRLWRPDGGASSLSFPSGSILEPLAGWEDRLVVVDGLGFHGASSHEQGMAAMLTNGGGADSETGGRSLDQVVAGHIGGATRLPSLELGVQTSAWGGTEQTRMSYAAPDRMVTPDDDPRGAWERLFGDMVGDPDEVAALRARRQSVLDLNRSQLQDLSGRLGASERAALDVHLDALDQLERNLVPIAGCAPPQAPDALAVEDNDRFPDLVDQQLDVAAAALSCDLTRVVSLQLSHTVSPTVFTWLDHRESHHALSHSTDDDDKGVARFVAAERWVAGRFAALLARLDGLPDPETGGSLLDSTLVVWAKELGDARTHVCDDVPWVLAGGGGAFEAGRLLDAKGASHGQLLVSLARAMGVPLDSFGDTGAGTGPLAGL